VTSAFAEMAKRVKVCLVGEGADVLFGGSGDYLDGTLKLQFLERGVMRAQALGLTLRPEVEVIVAALCEARDFDQYVNNLFAVNFADNLSSGLHYYDACSMAWGLELRDPFYDQELLSFVNTVPVEFKANRHLLVGKYLLRYIALELFGPAIIDAVLRRKIGLGQSCQGHTKKFTDLCEAELPERYIKEHPYGAYFTKKQDVLLFDQFELIFIKHRGHVPTGLTIADFIKKTRDFGGAAKRLGDTVETVIKHYAHLLDEEAEAEGDAFNRSLFGEEDEE
jgi:asparagine synthase (glutamine-hydrolysing)